LTSSSFADIVEAASYPAGERRNAVSAEEK
jgi:hypothetical protein